jgi:plastocyanin
MYRRRSKWRLLVLTVGFVVIAGGFLGVGPSVAAQGSLVVVPDATYLDVSAVNNFHFTPALIQQEPTGTLLSVNFTDADTSGAVHTFTIVGREGWQIPSSYNSAQITALAYNNKTYPNLVNVNATGTGTFYATFTSPATAGWYEFICTQPGHFQLGMMGYIAFGENLPSNLSVSVGPAGPGLAVYIIVGTIVGLTVIAIVLGFVVGRRRGGRHEMPPERLGYAEPLTPGGPAPPLAGGPPKK